MAGFFNLPSAKSTIKKDMKKLKKCAVSTPNKVVIKGKGTLADRIQSISSLVQSKFKDLADKAISIQDEKQLIEYIDKCIENGDVAIDTETMGLDPIEDRIVGMSLYTPNMKPAYIPINHVSYITNERVDNQLPISFVSQQINRLVENNVKTIFFNAPFDIRVIKHSLGVLIKAYWDTSIGSRVLNSNEPTGGRKLKVLHKKYCKKSGEALSYDKLFEGITFDLIPVNIGYLYAANDALITYELYEFQKPYLTTDSEICKKYKLEKLAYVFHDIEMKVMPAFIDMEENGVYIDTEYAKTISEKYHNLSDKCNKKAYEILKQYQDKIDDYKRKTPNCKLSEPINLGSPTQLAILLYDILKIDPPDKKNPRGTDANILSQIDNPFVVVLRDKKFFDKQLSTYVDKIPSIIHKRDGRVHGKFNQVGADCIVYDSLLLTYNGYIRIGDLFNGDEDNGQFYDCNTIIYNKNLRAEQSGAKIVYYNTDTYKITLRGGYSVEGTPNHPIICSGLNKYDIAKNKSSRQIKRLSETLDFRKLEDIKLGDIVAIPYGYNIFPTDYVETSLNFTPNHQHKESYKMPKYLSEDFAEFLGMYFANGSYKYYDDIFTVNLANKSNEVIERFKYLSKTLFGIDCTSYTEKYGVTTSFSSISFKELVKYLDKDARNKRIHNDIMKSPKSVICAFIRGMTLDSTFDSDQVRLNINCVDKVSCNFVKEVLLNIGIISGIKRNTYISEHDYMGNEVGNCEAYHISIVDEMYEKFLSEIGVIESDKRLIIDNYDKTVYLHDDNYYYAYVENIEKSTNNVYDLNVPVTHSFIANGMINHNTGRTSSNDPKININVNWGRKIRLIQGKIA